MRYLLTVSLLSLAASGALAGEYSLDSEVSAVTVYPAGATIIRDMAFDLPAGRHTLTISDIPYPFIKETLRLYGGEGLRVGATQVKRSRVAQDDLSLETRAQLEAEIGSLKAEIQLSQENAAAAGLIINAAGARIKLLESIGGQQAQGASSALESEVISVETLSALISLVGNETLTALQDAQAARVEIAAINREAEALRQKLKTAENELSRLSEPAGWRYVVSFDVEADADVAGVLQLSYVHDDGEVAGWVPVYDFQLDTEAEAVMIDRKISIWQSTGEDWDQARITVSTAIPFTDEMFEIPYSNLARYLPPAPPSAPILMRNSASAVFAVPEVVMVEEPSQMGGLPSFAMQGITATYILPEGTIIYGPYEGYEPSLITLDSTRFDASITARATMGNGETTAFVIAEFTNDSGAPFLPGSASYFRDGAFVRGGEWNDEIELIAAGATAMLDFGKIDGLIVERSTLRREDGSSGVLTTSNDRVVEYALSVKNVSNRAWDVVIYDRIPISEQEELLVDWSARPRPTEEGVDGRRGVLGWAFALEGGASQAIKLSYELQWPDGNELRIQP